MGKFLLGVIVGILVVVAGIYSYFWSGAAPVATSAQAMPFEKRLARTALHKRMDKEMPKSIPIQADENNYVAGATIYKEQCAVCHGLPNQQRSPIASGMFPKPPQLFKGKGVTDDPAGETYWKVANGIRLTGMPAFKGPLSDTQMWQVSVLLANADKLPPAALNALNNVEPNPVSAAVKTAAKTR
jgi:thiosulfate dehydrogenase